MRARFTWALLGAWFALAALAVRRGRASASRRLKQIGGTP